MTSTCGRSAGDWVVTARPSRRARSAVRTSPATPRTPSVPKSRRAMRSALTLRELRPLAGLLETGLLALLGTGVARQEAAALELGAQVGVGLEQRARDAVAQRARLGRDAAAVHAGDDVHPVLEAHRLQGLADRALQGRPREELVQRAAVDQIAAGARLEDHAGDRRLALAGRPVARVLGELDLGRDRLLVDDVLVVGRRLGLLGVGILVLGVA